MIAKRIIPCLDVRNGRVVKGVNFEGLRDVSSPVELGSYYSEAGADELVFYDITASAENRELFTDILREVASTIFIPLTVGGGINTLDDFDMRGALGRRETRGWSFPRVCTRWAGGYRLGCAGMDSPRSGKRCRGNRA